MPQLLHEYWEEEDGTGMFGPVREDDDRQRPTILPQARLVFSLWAASWEEAMQAYNDRLGYGPYALPDGVENHVYDDGEAAEQQAYLLVRSSGD